MSKSLSVIYQGFYGINNRLPAERIKSIPTDNDPLTELTAAVNVDLDDSGKPSRRDGYALHQSIPGAHDGFAAYGVCIYVMGGVLYRFFPATKVSTPLVNVGNDSKMRYFPAIGRIFFTNDVVVGEVRDGVAALFGTTSVPFKAPLPAGQAIAHQKARLYVAKDKVLWISDVKPLSRVDLRHGFKQFPDPITLIAPSVDGVYVGTDKAIYFGQGGNPLKMPFLKVSDCAALDIPVQYEDATAVKGLQIEGVFPFFTTEDGVCVGLPQGQLLNLTEERYVMPAGTTGASMMREINGQVHYITAYR